MTDLHVLYNPNSGRGQSEEQAKALATTLPATISMIFDPPSDADHIVLCGGDGSYHHLAQLGQKKSVYIVPTGTMNLLANLLKNTGHVNQIKQAFLTDPMHTDAYNIHMHDQVALATMNWSFGFDAKVMYALEQHRQGTLLIRVWQAVCFANQQPCTSHNVMIDGQDMGDYQGGIFSLLPSYAHPKFKIYHASKWAWHGLLFKQESIGQRIRLFTRSIRQPITEFLPTVCGTRIQIEGAPYLQIDGESYGQTSINAEIVPSPLAIMSSSNIR